MSVGLRVFMKRELPNKELIEKFRGLPTANVADCMERLGVMSSEIRLLSNPSKKSMVGVALTVKVRNGDNLFIHQAIEMGGPGDVIIVDNEGGRERSLAGAVMFGYCQYKGIEGLVIDGPIRDYDDVVESDWHIYATGVTSRGPYKTGPGEVNVPICCGGVVVNPGDIILGDMDGILVIPKEDAERILELAIPFAEKDASKTEKAILGELDRSWVSKAIQDKKVEIIDDVYKKGEVAFNI